MTGLVSDDQYYRITPDARRGLVRMELSGFWSEDVAVRVMTAYRAAVRSLGLPSGQHMVLCLLQDFPVQSAQMLATLQPLLDDSDISDRRRAVVDARPLAKLQGMRLDPGAAVAYFATEADALDWLFKAEVNT